MRLFLILFSLCISVYSDTLLHRQLNVTHITTYILNFLMFLGILEKC